jgi:hypothetical protein
VRIISDGCGRLGACGNFGALLAASEAPYFLFCDQDDVWLPEKASRLLDLMQSVEALKGTHVPIMAHSDLSLVDELLCSIHGSFHRYARIGVPPADRMWRLIMVSNIVTGCASIGNAALRRIALPIPPQAAMHDWWLALVAAMFGNVAYLPEATVLYRQHGVNTVGVKSWSLPAVMLRLLTSPCVHIGRARRSVRRSQEQATAFASRYDTLLDANISALIGGYGRLSSKPVWYRKAFLLRNRLRGRNPIYSAMLLILG